MNQLVAAQVVVITASILGFILGLLIMYTVIRLAVTHSLRSHYDWVRRNEGTRR